MKESTNVFIKLLSAAIFDNAPDFITILPDWDSVYKEAKAHQVHTILFPLLEKLPVDLRPATALFEAWKYETLQEAALQLLHIEQMEKVFLLLHKDSIPVIALKGLILRSYYPYPELRTMGDADILVHREDIKKVHAILVSLGYRKGNSIERHTTYSINGYPNIELHEILTDNMEMERLNHFTYHAWENALPTLIGSAPVLTLSVKDQIVYLILHIIHHVLLSGVGIRQLCDLTIFATSHWEEIIWEDILYEMEPYGYDKFTLVLLSICQELLGLSLSENVFVEEEADYETHKNLLIEDIISAGVYGKRTREKEASRHVLLYIKGTPHTLTMTEADVKPTALFSSAFCNLLRFFFPSPDKLGYQYRYAKKYTILLPLAWIHRAFHNIKQLSLLSFILNRKITDAYNKRIALLTWLKLR